MWENLLQIAGVLTGAVGAFYAYRQYGLARGPGGAVISARGDSVSEMTTRFQTSGGQESERNTSGAVGMMLVVASLFMLYDDRNTDHRGMLTIFMLASIAGTGVVVDFFDKPRWIGIDGAGIVVYRHQWISRPVVQVRFEWSVSVSVAVAVERGPQNRRWLLLRMNSRYGVGTIPQQSLWNDEHKAFMLCELADVKPAESTLLDSISDHFGRPVAQ